MRSKVRAVCDRSPAACGRKSVQLQSGSEVYKMSGFVPSYYIRSGALSKSLITVSEKDTGLVPEDKQNPFGFVHLIPT